MREQTICIIEQSHVSIKQALKYRICEWKPLWHKYVIIEFPNYNTSYHASFRCEQSSVFHGRIPHNVPEIKLGIRPEQAFILIWQIDQDFPDQTEMISHDVCKSFIQANIKNKSYQGKKANAPKLKHADYVYVSQPKADRQESEIAFTAFRWLDSHVIENVLPNKKYLVRGTGTNKTQALHRMLIRQFTHQQNLPDLQITPQERKHDPKVSTEHADLFARASEYDYGRPIFDAHYDNAAPLFSHEIAVRSDLPNEKLWNTPGTSRERSPGHFPQRDELCDVTHTYCHK